MTTGSSGPDQKSTMNRPVMNAARTLYFALLIIKLLILAYTGRPGQETDIAATILFLASVGGTFYNHQILFPDGGETLIGPAAI